MAFDAQWRALRERVETLDPDAVLVTPDDERVFAVDRTDDERIVVQFRDDGERTLRRDQFEVLADSLQSDALRFADLPPGVGPYATVLSLAPGFAVDESGDALRSADGESAGEAGATDDESTDDGGAPAAGAADLDAHPFVRSRWDVRRPPEEVHDDALLVADFLERHDATERDSLSESALVDLYVLLSDLQWGADDLRRTVGDDLLDQIGPDGRLHGQYGTVSRTRRERRQLKDEGDVLAALDAADVPHGWVMGVDEDKLDVVLAATEVDEADVYDVHEQYYVQKTDVESDAKRSRLQGLRDRLAELDDEEADELREEIDALEDRIDDVLAAG